MIDYRKMLISYIELVGNAEGTDFLPDGPTADIGDFTQEEAVEMAKLRDTGRNYRYRYYDDNGLPITHEARKGMEQAEAKVWQARELRSSIAKLEAELPTAIAVGSVDAVKRIHSAIDRCKTDLAKCEAAN